MTITNNVISIEYDSIDNLELPLNLCELKIKFKDVLYEFVINLKQDSDKMIVLGSANIPYKYLDYWEGKPYYNRWKWNFTESFICYNDPTRYLGKRIPGLWGIGTEDDYYLKNIKNIILKITSKLNISNENILFFGSSMGGFMSLLLSTMVKGSKAIADIPQLDLKTYREGNWYNIKKFCFKNLSDKYINEHFGHRLNFIQMMKKEQYVPNAILILDYSVPYDVSTQYAPFFEEKLSELPFKENDKLKIIIKCENKGHVPISREETMNLIYKTLYQT